MNETPAATPRASFARVRLNPWWVTRAWLAAGSAMLGAAALGWKWVQFINGLRLQCNAYDGYVGGDKECMQFWVLGSMTFMILFVLAFPAWDWLRARGERKWVDR